MDPALPERAGMSRRGLIGLAAVGGAGTAAALSGCGGSDDKEGKRPPGASDLEIANYALTLEYLEADFYARAVASKLFQGRRLALFEGFAEHEARHVDALETAVGKLGGRSVPRPRAQFSFRNSTVVLKIAQRVENLGAAAYLGQADQVRSKELLALLLSIHSVEARHAAALNIELGKNIAPTGAFARGASMDEVVKVLNLYVVG
jgi:rubrerythrin